MALPNTLCAFSLALGLLAGPSLAQCPPVNPGDDSGGSQPAPGGPVVRTPLQLAPLSGGRPSAPTTGRGPQGGVCAPTTGRLAQPTQVGVTTVTTGVRIATAPSAWKSWWHFNRDGYLDLKERLHSPDTVTGDDSFFLGHGSAPAAAARQRIPHPAQTRELVVPALRRTLLEERDPLLIAEAVVAAARSARHLDGAVKSQLEPALRAHMGHGNIYVSELAVLAYGLLSHPPTAPALAGLVMDDDSGRQLVGARGPVSTRVRAFAAYGLGLLAQGSENEDVRRFATHALTRCLEDRSAPVDVEVACVSALALAALGAPGAGSLDDRTSPRASQGRMGQVAFLLEVAEDRRRERRVQAHALTSLARMAADLPTERKDELKEQLAPRLSAFLKNRSKHSNEVVQGATLALAHLGDDDDDALDVQIRQRLEHVVAGSGDQATRGFALLALAEVSSTRGYGEDPGAGRDRVADLVLRQLARGKSFARPWAGLALGVMGHRLAEDGYPVPLEWQSALRDALEDASSGDESAAYCVALGLIRDPAAARLIRKELDRGDDVRRYAAVGLGMLGDRASIAQLERELRQSANRPDDLFEFATALALLADDEAAEQLFELVEEGSFTTRVSATRALGQVGDARTIERLVTLLADNRQDDAVRAAAAGALGRVVETSDLPWSSSYAAGTNFLATTETLYEPGGGGVLNLH